MAFCTPWFEAIEQLGIILHWTLFYKRSVKPVLSRSKNTLIGLGASLLACVLLLINLEGSQKYSYVSSQEAGGRAVPGVYNEDSARTFEPDFFCGEPDLQ
ncbi:hypothetical protein Acr_20g0003460 [Actinidia rufa]|uniref:Uncharacterized protein n=1 Tax=Actinidia rufa TaxID=165716 RepID=A0A7J0GCX7_9ERIC|nr:hypothetical protein Acr_20g0003460 [Actinidia rufa]